MIATLKESAGRMSDLLARRSQHHSGGNRAEAPAATDILPLTERVAATRRAQHPIVTTGPHDAIAQVDRAALELVLRHLIQTAIAPRQPPEPVTPAVSTAGERAPPPLIRRPPGVRRAGAT